MNTAEVGLIRQVGQDLIQLREQQGDGNAQQHYDQLLPEKWGRQTDMMETSS